MSNKKKCIGKETFNQCHNCKTWTVSKLDGKCYRCGWENIKEIKKIIFMKKDIQTLAFEIKDWSDKTFGNGDRAISILHHLGKEIPELIEAMEKFKNYPETAEYTGLDYSDRNGGESRMTEKSFNKYLELQHNVYEEFADCFMLLLDSASHFPMTTDTLIAQTQKKLEINKKRKWGKPDINGVVEHIK